MKYIFRSCLRLPYPGVWTSTPHQHRIGAEDGEVVIPEADTGTNERGKNESLCLSLGDRGLVWLFLVQWILSVSIAIAWPGDKQTTKHIMEHVLKISIFQISSLYPSA